MSDYAVIFARSARKELESLSALIINRVISKVAALQNEPRPQGCRKLTGENNLWRIRIGDYRVIYMIDDRKKFVDVIAIRHRRDAYR